MDMNQWGPRIVDVGEGPAPTDDTFQADNSVVEGFNFQLLDPAQICAGDGEEES